MSLIPTDMNSLRIHCFRELGWPAIKINIDEDSANQAIYNALQFFQDFHHDAMDRWYLKHQLTTEDKENGWIPITENIFGVTRIFPIGSTNASVNMFDLRYQLRLHELYDFTSTSYVSYVMTQQHIRTLDILFSGETPIRFNRHSNRLYLDWNWKKINVGEYIVIEGWIIIDPNEFSDVWNDRLFKRLATAHVKKIWANALRKYDGVQLIGGVTMNGQTLYNEAEAEIDKVENLIKTEQMLPPQFLLG